MFRLWAIFLFVPILIAKKCPVGYYEILSDRKLDNTTVVPKAPEQDCPDNYEVCGMVKIWGINMAIPTAPNNFVVKYECEMKATCEAEQKYGVDKDTTEITRLYNVKWLYTIEKVIETCKDTLP